MVALAFGIFKGCESRPHGVAGATLRQHEAAGDGVWKHQDERSGNAAAQGKASTLALFFLEYSKVANPDVKAEEVMEAFWKCRAECHIALSSGVSKGFRVKRVTF